jgi:uncharacterized membrane protein (UPF0127 family)
MAAPAARNPLPEGSKLVASLELTGGERAVLFDDSASYVGVVGTIHGTADLAWRKRLPFTASSLFAAGEAGSFGGIGTASGGAEGEFFAYRVSDGHVHPALEGGADGLLTAGEGVRLTHCDVVLRVHDDAHQGSVQYALFTRYQWETKRFVPVATTMRPDYPRGDLPHPRAQVKGAKGDEILIRLEVASTEQAREIGLMNRTILDPDSGMVFAWSAPVLESFWMENTYIPLTVAFLAPDGTIREMQDMQPLTTDLHTPAQPYQYAIEVNQGFFARFGIKAGDKIALQLS